ncbi:uncharacterized protein LOC129926391 [Biomphalaria glabrata]|uniref:Uncharacterized protein LOC129926391 n=1 Tax=Biomphalaria glabrata TaxID=6526 RepID=A0A9W3AFN1_BIOGL|nr:uncharacterized protein LOC129926391 [Biomphalaria glabrata]
MASNTRSKTDSDRKLKIQELTETAALLELEGPSRSDYIRQKLDEWELEEKLAREREFELAMEREKNEHELARDKEKNEHELAMERERQATERAKIAQENEAARTVADSQPASPASSQGSSISSPNIPFEPFDEKSESVEVYLTRFEEVARYYSLPKDRWCFRLAQCLRGKAYEAYTKLPSYQREDFEALKEALLVQFELTSDSYHKKFRGSRLERKETYVNLCDRLDKYLGKWLALSKMPETFEGLRNLILAEQLRDCLTQETRIYVNEQQATDPSDIAIAADRYVAARRDQKAKTPVTEPQSSETSPAQPTPHNQNQNNQARVPSQHPSHQSNRPPHQSRQNNSYHPSHRDSHNTRDDRRTRQQQTPHVVSALTTVRRPKTGNPVGPEIPYIPPHPSTSPPGVEKALINGVQTYIMFDTACSFTSIIKEALIDSADLTGETVEIQTIDKTTPPMVLPIARVHVECRYVHGTINAAVMESPVYDFILGSQYVPLGNVKKPYFSLPVGRTTRQKDDPNLSNTGRHHSAPQFNRTKEIKPLIPDIDSVRRRWRGQQFWPPRINMIPAWNHKGGSRHRFPPSPSCCNYTPSPLTASGRTHRYPNKPDLNHRSRYSPPKHNSPRWDRN